ncbi:MAG: NAD(P)/FAD-dependent oxidoreductase [bacterium]
MDKRSKIAVIGSGISGLSAAWGLKDVADITLIEKDIRFGGHTHTFAVEEAENTVNIDTGFMVFNEPNYPLLVRLFAELGIDSYPTKMSFSVSLGQGELEYSGSGIRGLFAQPKNWLSPAYWKMLNDILRFNRGAVQYLREGGSVSISLDKLLDSLAIGERARNDYLYPMAASIWSCPRSEIAAFPARRFCQFFLNHGLLNLKNRPEWRTVEGGSSRYVEKMINRLGVNSIVGSAVETVERQPDRVDVKLADGRRYQFDEVVLACHADQSLAVLADASPNEAALLRSVPYQSNRVVLHTDRRLMPKTRSVWSCWNYLGESRDLGESEVGVTYWMNALQNLDTSTDYFVSLNPGVEPAQDSIVAEFEYEHPVFGQSSLRTDALLRRAQGLNRVWFAGAWTGYGFHEDGVRSGIEVAKKLGAEIDWGSSISRSNELIAPVRVQELAQPI